jgi:hypothetical protein
MAENPVVAAIEAAYASACEAERLVRSNCTLGAADRISRVVSELHDMRLEISPATREDYLAEAARLELMAQGSRERAEAL